MACVSVEETINDALGFLRKFDWIHKVQVTKIFDGTLQNIPTEWITCLTALDTEKINNFPFLGERSAEMYSTWPESLHEFLSMASRLSVVRDQLDLKATAVSPNMSRGMNPKKLHEVSYMASLVHDVVSQAGCDLIVDVGSGLGYLDHVLHQAYGHTVLGLETAECHVTGAEARAAGQGLKCGGIKSAEFNLTSNAACFQQFETFLSASASSVSCECKTDRTTARQASPIGLGSDPLSNQTGETTKPSVCLIGLHCCGDLTPAMLALFHHSTSVQAICCVSCCYHKMSLVSGDYPSFPLSSHCRKQYDGLKEEDSLHFILPQTLRLGAQETRDRWKQQSDKDHIDHTHHVAFRGLLELADCGDPAIKRKLVRKCDFSSFEAFLESYFSHCHFSEAKISSGKSALNDLYSKYKDDIKLIEIFTALQTVVQPVIETLIYNDRLLWLMEQGYENVKVLPVFNEAVSPRNLATVVIK